jgi:pyruvate dehydrogenase E2 component (dihydrolipoamide acetyltransferase)
VTLPEVSENVAEATVVKVLVAPGETVKADQPLLEVETDKALFELPSPEGGVVAEVLVKSGDRIAVGQVLLRLEAAEDSAERTLPAETAASPEAAAALPATLGPSSLSSKEGPSPDPSPPDRGALSSPASPAVRKLARELGVDPSSVKGTGPRGRITLEDVKARAKALLSAPAGGRAAASRPLPDFSRWGSVRREPFSTVRRVTAEAMAHAWSVVPQVTQHDRADLTSVEAFRRKSGAGGKADAGTLTVTAFVVKVAALALRAFPALNASVDAERMEAIFKDYVHVGVAVDTEHGLLVPVLRDADRKGLREIARELRELAERARLRRLSPSELEGGTFTVSNLGGIGGTAFSPIVSWPQVAILGVSRAEILPRWNGEAFEPRPFLPLSLSYDHRLVDGALGARFLRHVCEGLEDPWNLVL